MSRHAAPRYLPGGQRISQHGRDWMRLPPPCPSEEIFLAIDRELGAPNHRELYGAAGNRIDGRRLARVMQFVSENIAGPFTVADLADVACLSPAHFARSFKATTGWGPHEFVRRIRLTVAKRMLADHQLPISDIALSTGFSSQSNFSRAFRDVTGMTPGDYRAGS
jgi:transcriptional regulator GlxA family with amidase domain